MLSERLSQFRYLPGGVYATCRFAASSTSAGVSSTVVFTDARPVDDTVSPKRGSSNVVGQLDHHDGVVASEREMEAVHLAAEALNGLADRVARALPPPFKTPFTPSGEYEAVTR